MYCYTVNWTLGCLSWAHGMSSSWGRVTNTSWHGPNSGLKVSTDKMRWWFLLLMTCKDRLSHHTKNVTISWTENSKQVVMKPLGFWEGRTEHAKTWRDFKETEVRSDLWSNLLKQESFSSLMVKNTLGMQILMPGVQSSGKDTSGALENKVKLWVILYWTHPTALDGS